MKDKSCFVCRESINDFSDCTLEHIIPRSKGGTNRNENLSISHQKCNRLKGDRILRFDELEESLSVKQSGKKSFYELMTLETLWDSSIWTCSMDSGLVEQVLQEIFPYFETLQEHFGDVLFRRGKGRRTNAYIRLKFAITTLHKQSSADDLVEMSMIIENETTEKYWSLIFSVLLLEKYLYSSRHQWNCFSRALEIIQSHEFRCEFPYQSNVLYNLLDVSPASGNSAEKVHELHLL